MWPFSKIERLENEIAEMSYTHWCKNAIFRETTRRLESSRSEVADLKDSNARLADALAAAKVRAGDTWNMDA